MKRKPLAVSLLISLGTGVIAGFLLPEVWRNTRKCTVPPLSPPGMGIPDSMANSVYIDGDCSIQNLYEESKSRNA